MSLISLPRLALLIALVSTLLLVSLPGAAADKDFGRLYVANLLVDGPTVFLDCGNGKLKPVAKGDVLNCGAPESGEVGLALMSTAPKTLTLGEDASFVLDLETPGGSARLQGATETQTGLIGGKVDRFIYLWHVGETP
jgi:hypothetical protein